MKISKNLHCLLLIYISIISSYSEEIIASKFPFYDTLIIDSPNYVKTIKLDDQLQYNTLKVTIKVSDDYILNGIKPCLVLAETEVPSPSDIKRFFGKDEVKSNFDTQFEYNYSVDVEACTMADKVQFVQIDPPFNFNSYKVAIYDLASVNRQYNVEILIDYMYIKSNNKQCPDACSQQRYQEDQNICASGSCICSDGYIGKRCQVKVEQISDDGKQYTAVLQPKQWTSYKLSLTELKDSLALNIIDLHQACHISIILQGESSINVPNFYHDFYNIPSSDNQICQIGNEILKPNQQNYSYQTSSSQFVVIISFYNPNQEPISFKIKVSSSGFQDEESSSLKNILVIAISILSVICFIPFAYIFFKSCTKKSDQIQNQSIGEINQNLPQDNIQLAGRGLSVNQSTFQAF